MTLFSLLFSQHNPFAPLDSLYRIEAIREKLVQLKNSFEVAKREGSKTPELGHFVFQVKNKFLILDIFLADLIKKVHFVG